MARIKKKVKKRAKALKPNYKGMTKEEKKAAEKEFEEALETYKKGLKKKKRSKRVRLLLCICFIVVWRQFHSKASKKYKRQELGRR